MANLSLREVNQSQLESAPIVDALKLRIMTRAFRIRLAAGENFENIAADYPALTVDDLEAIKSALGIEVK